MKTIVIFLLITTVLAISVSGQESNTADAKKVEMKKLDRMIGQWKGSGWIQQGPKRDTFTGTESVQRKIDGLILLIEGKFANPEGKVIHETLAAMSYDDKAKLYKMRAYLLNGNNGEYDFKIANDSFEWGFQTPGGGVIRYTMTITAESWTEAGEFSRDGKSWIKFFEMKLERVK